MSSLEEILKRYPEGSRTCDWCKRETFYCVCQERIKKIVGELSLDPEIISDRRDVYDEGYEDGHSEGYDEGYEEAKRELTKGKNEQKSN